jgi:protein disulfide-isomerase
LLKLDFPRRKELSPEEKEQNHKLGQQFAIEGFPTYVLVDPTGKELKRQIGYLEGGPKKFIEWAKS